MKQNLSILLLLYHTLFIWGPAFAADLNKGVAAYQIGNYEVALEEFFSLADQGHAVAEFNLGVMYRGGVGIQQNDHMAVKYFTLAAKNGLVAAQSLLGSMYRGGNGVKQDDKNAIKWYTLAAEQGNTDAQYYLGVIYRRGVLQNYIYAHMWWNIAALSGDKMAAKNMMVVAKKMSISQISKALSLAKECVTNNIKNC